MDLLMGAMPAASTTPRLGTVTTVDGVRMVTAGGGPLLASWADPIVVDDGDSVDVLIYSAGVGQSLVRVTGRSTTQPRTRTATVKTVPAGSPTIVVTAAGVDYDAEPVGGPYVAGDLVHLDWGAGRPRVIGKVTLTSVPVPPPPAPEQPPVQTGQTSAPAVWSRTYWPGGGWGSVAGDGQKVIQGTWKGATSTGAWFYGTPFTGLAGRTITRIRFRLGDRLPMGASNDPATFHFYAHTSPGQPAGDTNRVMGPYEWVAAPGQQRVWIDLPIDFAPAIIAGGGIAIAGEPYAGMAGVTAASPDSGSLIFDWVF